MDGKKTVSLKCKKGLAAHIKDKSSPFELNPEETIEIAEDAYHKLHVHSAGRDKTKTDICNIAELLGYLASQTISKSAHPETKSFILSKQKELHKLIFDIGKHLYNGKLVDVILNTVRFGEINQQITMANLYGIPMLLGIKNMKATKDGGKVRAEIYKKNRPKYQQFINSFMKKHPEYTYTAALEEAALKFVVSTKTIRRHTTKPQFSEIS